VTEVTHQTKTIFGVFCVVVTDTVWIDGELAERTEDWYAQDRHGNVWYFGEDSKEYEDGEGVSTAGSWQAGGDGAQPGIIMEGRPQVGDVYHLEFYAGEAEDMAKVFDLHVSQRAGHQGVVATQPWCRRTQVLRQGRRHDQGRDRAGW
jgi:hypothetical protein